MCSKLFKVEVINQKLVYTEEGFEGEFDFDEDHRQLSFFSVKDGGKIIVRELWHTLYLLNFKFKNGLVKSKELRTHEIAVERNAKAILDATRMEWTFKRVKQFRVGN